MDPKRYRRLKELVDHTLDLPEFQRDVYLQQHCDDADLLAEARDLLLYHGSEQEGIPGQVVLSADLPDLINSQVGSYKILETLGEGGMGVVYLAAQSAPLRRKVALKVIKLGMDTREVMTRFESERQALALMDHANIAKVFDAGATDEGRPYFVMEYIPGVPLNQYCRDQALGLPQRLDLFLQICRGVQHAHQKGIIHRDLKPGNILVTEVEGKAVPKIIDFGVAKATAPNLAGQTLFTRLGQVIGTPEYMSPEQAGSSMTDVDTRSDIYSLGVLLYEILTGALPLERRDILQAGLKHMALHVQNEVPKKPSTRLDSMVQKPESGLGSISRETRILVRQVRGDLDWITMKALEKERDRRYDSVGDLAADLNRHLTGRAVAAGPPSSLYRARKFLRRNRMGVGFLTVVMLGLISFTVWQTLQSRIIHRERRRAQANERLAYARQQMDLDPTVATAFALSSLEIMDQPGTREVVRQALASGPVREEFPRWGQSGNPISVDASPDGKFCAVTWSQSSQPTVGIYSLADYSQRIFKAPCDGIVYNLVFSSDGGHLAATGQTGLDLWRVADGKHLLNLPYLGGDYFAVPFRLADPGKLACSKNGVNERTQWFEIDLHTGSLTSLGRSRGSQFEENWHFPAINLNATWILDFDRTEVFLQRIEDLDTDQAIRVGGHEATIRSVAMDESASTGVSIDVEGTIKVWDLVPSPPRKFREFQAAPGPWKLVFDPFSRRFLASGGGKDITVFDLAETPERAPVILQGRSHWAHDGVFLPDGSIISTNNGGTCPVVYWKTKGPRAWSLDLGAASGPCPQVEISRDGNILYLWDIQGDVSGVPLVSGVAEGTGQLGQSSGWAWGVMTEMLLDDTRKRLLLSNGLSGTQSVDLTSGQTANLPELGDDDVLWEISESGRFASFQYFYQPHLVRIFDLDSLKTHQVLDLGNPDFKDFCIVGDSSLVALGIGHISRFPFGNPSAPPDTLWRKDGTWKGALLEHGRNAALKRADGRLVWLDLTDGRQKVLGHLPPTGFLTMKFLASQDLLAVAGSWGAIEIFNVENGTHNSLSIVASGDQDPVLDLAFDPLSRWLISRHRSKLLAWTLPLDPIFSNLPYEDLLDSVRSRTNVRVVGDATQANGFRIVNTTDPDS